MSRLSKGEREFVGAGGDGGAVQVLPSGQGVASGEDAQVLDTRGLSSPLHLLRAHRMLRALPPGQLLRVVTNAPHTIPEFQALAKYVVNYELLSQEERDGEVVHVLRRKR